MDTKEKFLDASSRLFRSQGYSGTGLKQIVKESGAPIGSMYHYFSEGKEQLAAEAVIYASDADDQRLRETFAGSKTALEAVTAIFRSEMKRLANSDFVEGCPVAAVANDVASVSDRVRNACSQSFQNWETTISQGLVGHGHERSDAKALAGSILIILEGATLLSRTHKSTKPFRQAISMMEVLLGRSEAKDGS